jgi:AP-4 complex subunit sigma-1
VSNGTRSVAFAILSLSLLSFSRPFLSSPLSLLPRYFENVCELDIMFNLEKAHFILDEMVMNGCLIETNKMNVLKPIAMIEKAS